MAETLDRLKFVTRFTLIPRSTVIHNNATIWQALDETWRNIRSEEERKQWERIEDYRYKLLRDEKDIEFVDFGMGSRIDGQADGEIESGARSMRKVSEVALASKSPLWCGLLHKIVRLTGAKNCVEMGTCLAISASYLAAALPEGGRLVTMEGSPGVADMAADTLQTLVPDRQVEIRRGPFHETLNPVLSEMAPIDFVFVDGHHDEEATERYFRQLLPNMQQQGVMVFDDIRWSPGMRRAWKYISANAPGTCIDLGTLGLVLLP